MLGSIRTIFGIAAVTLCLTGVVFSDAGSLLAIEAREDTSFSAIRGREPAIVLQEVANHLRPESSLPLSAFFTMIETKGASDIQVFNRSDLSTVVGGWGLPEPKVSGVVQTIEGWIKNAIAAGVHDVIGHSLKQVEQKSTSLTMTTLICSIRVRQTGADHQWMVELGHIVMITETIMAEHVQPTGRDGLEMEAILDQTHFNWALENIPVAKEFLPAEPTEVLERRVMSDLRFEMIMRSVQLFAETWEKLAQALASNVTQSVRRKVCLGFDSVAYHAESFVLQDVPRAKSGNALKRIIRANDLPPAANKGNILLGVEYSDKFTWVGENMMYQDQKGNQSFLFLAKHGNVYKSGKGRNQKKRETVDIIYSRVKSNYLLAQDMLVVREQKSFLGGIWKSDKTYINHVPPTLTPADTQVLQMFWQMIAYKQMAQATRVTAPKMPNLKGLCDRSMD
ncbi:hypothetical protein BGZ70_001492 [Mortierella alpina]|uniref:Uncharacterized protein n=1 Tax=Mortierella alpina TaxID=64518 RepID=A0A9P6IW78_MORAP|nr:hypothetical protein BGZ70_001492 [Mortierella alpina]